MSAVGKFYWVPDEESGDNCPICEKKFEANFLEGSVSGKTHCRRCGKVYCFSCCSKKLLIPENEIIRPPSSETINSLRFDKTDKQKSCLNCAKVLEPRQDAIKATFATGKTLSDFASSSFSNLLSSEAQAPAPTPAPALAPASKPAAPAPVPAAPKASAVKVSEPYFSVKVLNATGLPVKAGTVGLFCQATVGTASMLTQTCKTSSGSATWGNVLEFHVDGPVGNMLKLVCYAEEASDKVMVGEAVVALSETPSAGRSIMLSAPSSGGGKHVNAGQVTLGISFVGAKETSKQAKQTKSVNAKTQTPAQRAPPAVTTVPAKSAPAASGPLGFLMENGWAIYLVFIVLALSYKFTSVKTFGGESLVVRPGTVIGNGKWVSSSTHTLVMQKDGNLVLSAGTSPKDGDLTTAEWQSGRPYPEKECPKCVASLDKAGVLSVKDGKTVLKEFSVASDPWLSAAINFSSK